MDTFTVGEIAIFFSPESPRNMEECTVVAALMPGRIVDDAAMTWRAAEFYRVTFSGDDIKYAAEPHQLKKRPGPTVPPKAKREPLGSWDTCLFKPSRETVH